MMNVFLGLLSHNVILLGVFLLQAFFYSYFIKEKIA